MGQRPTQRWGCGRRRWAAAAAAAATLALAAPRAARGFACPPAFAAAQCSALADLWVSTGGATWAAAGGWAAAAALEGPTDANAPSPCTFFGVTCNAAGAVVGIALPDNLLSGTLPASLTNLTSLTSLNVSTNYLWGPVPTTLPPALATLDVGTNYLTGAVPPALAAVANLTLGPNNLSPVGVPPALCAGACATGALLCASTAPSSCTCSSSSCRPNCPLSPWGPSNQSASLVGACSSLSNACFLCLTSLVTPVLAAGILSSDSISIFGCLAEATPWYIQLGASLPTINALRACTFPTSGPPAQQVTCTVSVNMSAAMAQWSAAAVGPCSSANGANTELLCGACTNAMLGPFLSAGVPNTFAALESCAEVYLSDMLAAGIDPSIMTRTITCPPKVPPPGPTALVAAPPSGGGSVVVGGAVGGSLGGAAVLAVAAAAVVALRRARAARGQGQGGRAAGDPYLSPDPSARLSLSRGDSGGSYRVMRPLMVRREEVVLGEALGVGASATVHVAQWHGTVVAAKAFASTLAVLQLPDAAASGSAAASVGTTAGSPAAGEPQIPLRHVSDSLLWHVTGAAGGGAGAWDSTRTESGLSVAAEREMAMLQTLRHPNICALYGLVACQPPILLMELCHGGSLARLLARSTRDSLRWAQRLRIAAGVATGVEFLHSQDPPVIHCDLKSANVVLTSEQVPKLCDFGIALHGPDLLRVAVGGTLAYMAPEVLAAAVAAAGGDAVTPRAGVERPPPEAIDVFGIGVVLHDIAHLGMRPGDQQAELQSKRSRDAAQRGSGHGSHGPRSGYAAAAADSGRQRHGWSELFSLALAYNTGRRAIDVGPHVPRALGALMLDCTALEPRARPSAGRVRDALRELIASEAEAAARGTPWPEEVWGRSSEGEAGAQPLQPAQGSADSAMSWALERV